MSTYLEKRISPDIMVPAATYNSGLMYVVSQILVELERLLTEEGRFFGIMLIYKNRVQESLSNYFKECDLSSDEEYYQRILYLLRPIIVKEYKKLKTRKLSSADCLIVIIRKLLEQVQSDSKYYHRIEKIINKIYDNIKNRGKTSSLHAMMRLVKDYYERGVVGNYRLDSFSLQNVEKKQEELKSTEEKISEENKKITEVVWKD